MAEKKLLWLKDEKDYEGNYYSALIDADEVYDAVYVGDQGARVWYGIPGNTNIDIPKIIIWEDEEYKSLLNMDSNDMREYLDFLVGQKGQEISEYEKQSDCLAFDYYNNEFASLEDWETCKCYDYFESSNPKTITLTEYGYNTEYELEITGTYNLDYLDYIDYKHNSTNLEYGGLGNHAKLHKVIIDGDKDDNRILWHEWSQWSGSELDSGCLMTVEEVLERLKNHPELEEITEWLGVMEG